MSEDERPRGELRIAYLCSLYPAVSHTFIMREIDALRRLGVQIKTFSIHRAAADQLLSDADRAAQQSTYAILPPSWPALASAHCQAILCAPLAYLSTLRLALGLAARGARGRLWQVFYFAEAVLLWRQCRRSGIRHVHAHLANVAADVALLAASLGCAIDGEDTWSWSFTMHGPTELFDVGRFRLAAKLRHARFVICISDFARSQLMALSGFESWGKLHVVHCGVPLEHFTRRAAPETIEDAAGGNRREPDVQEDPMILYVGRLVPEKGQSVLLHALALLLKNGRRAQLTLIGEGAQRSALECLADQLGIAAETRFTGALGQEEIRAFYERACVFCLPSFAEGVPCVLMEAMAMEVPVVSTMIAGIPELVQDETGGLLVSPGRPDQLALALERLLGDGALRQRLSARGRRKVQEEFDSERSAEVLCAIFARELCLPAGPRPLEPAGAA